MTTSGKVSTAEEIDIVVPRIDCWLHVFMCPINPGGQEEHPKAAQLYAVGVLLGV